MFNSVFTIARYTFYEAVRNHLFMLAVFGLICFFGLAEFVGELAITESTEMRAMLLGGGLRIFAVLTVSLFVVASLVREFNDKGFELFLSLPIPRHEYLLGKLAGFVLLGLVVSVLAGFLLLIYCSADAVLIWSISLFLELVLIISLSIFCFLTFNNITLAYTVVITFYFLSRSINAIQLISSSPILETRNFSQEFMELVIDLIAYVLPGLHDFTQSEWLAYGAGWNGLAPVMLQSGIYFVLLVAASLFDLYRKEL